MLDNNPLCQEVQEKSKAVLISCQGIQILRFCTSSRVNMSLIALAHRSLPNPAQQHRWWWHWWAFLTNARNINRSFFLTYTLQLVFRTRN